ncbi:hypothetical protein L2Y96_18160 [Luteibacter aegosomaticola]|uniref:hypothetical protein n=1 Tax=Luteibacter aegosomaticola TaxID=2911538 RepID=UPI001FFBF7C6|nr:hypothetical protein [Luteibacter aegosomaticola]UPG89303.1 hypothetical protein L2Y96_18160 [Luteibacter aegosomaticola]
MNQSLHQRQALTAYNIVQASKRHDLRVAEAEYRRPARPNVKVRGVVSKPRRAARTMDRIRAFCDWFADNGWVLIVGLCLAVALLFGRANGVIQ